MKFNMQPIYGFFAATEGFGEFCVIISLAAIITLAFMSKLTESFAMSLTALNIGGIAHDQLSEWMRRRYGTDDHHDQGK
jgi:hypothetical protein